MDPVLVIGERHIDRARIAEICGRFGLSELAVFGSVARGEESDDSDVDLRYVARRDEPGPSRCRAVEPHRAR